MSTYSTNLNLTLIGTGELPGTWGDVTNTNLGTLLEQAISGYVTQAITNGADTVITIPAGATGVARNMFLECTGALTAARNLIVPANKKLYFIYNNTTGGFAVTVKVSGLTGVSVPNGAKMLLVSNGTDIVTATSYMASLTLGTPLAVASGGTGGNTSTGTGAVVLAAAPTVTGLKETKVAVAASAIDMATGNFFSKTITGTTTFTVSNVPATGTAGSFILDLTNGGAFTVTWWSGVKWAYGVAPTLTAAGRDVLGFFTYDGGTTWNGLVLGKDMK